MDREVTIETDISEFSRDIVDFATCRAMDPKFQELRDRVDRQIDYYDRIFNAVGTAFKTEHEPRPRMTPAQGFRELRRQLNAGIPLLATYAKRRLVARQKIMIILEGEEKVIRAQAVGVRHKKTRKEVVRYYDERSGKEKRIAMDPSKIIIGEARERF